jgi:ubiquinone/menaquinone biosynthesis C-methylase UbiE
MTSGLPRRTKGQSGAYRSLVPAGVTPADVVQEMTGWPEQLAALLAFVKLCLPEHLADGQPCTAEELELRVGVRPERLARVMRLLVPLGVVSQPAPGVYVLGPVGRVLRADAPGSMRAAVLMLGIAELQQPLWRLAEILVTGESPFTAAHGSPYDFFAKHPEHGRVFAEYMTGRSAQIAPHVADEFCGEGGGTLVDLGGGHGTIVAEVLAEHPGWRGVLLERPELLAGAERYLSDRGVLDRCELVAGDFFCEIPAKADVYLLAGILHNYGDGQAVKLLRNVRAVMGPGGRLLCVDMLLPAGDAPHPGLALDVRMLTRTQSGRERTRSEYLALLERGLGGTVAPRVIRLPLGLSLVSTHLPSG